MSKKLKKSEALNEVAKVLQAALEEYEALEKSFGEDESEEDKEKEAEESAESQDSEDSQNDESEGDDAADSDNADAPAAQDENEDEDEDDKEKEMDDETLKSEFAKMQTKMTERGLLKKNEDAAQPATDLKKYEDQVSSLTKTVNDLQATIKKIANTPAPRKGATGYNPLKKNTEGENEAQPLNKGEAINKLLDLKKSGKNVPTSLINRIEGNRLTNEDIVTIKGLIG